MSSYRRYNPHQNPDDEGMRRRLGARRRAAEHQDILGAQRLLRALEEIEFLQRELRDAGEGLQAVLSIRPLAKAYARFQTEGGVTGADWQKPAAGPAPAWPLPT